MKGRFNHYRIPQTIGEPYGIQNVQVAINSLW